MVEFLKYCVLNAFSICEFQFFHPFFFRSCDFKSFYHVGTTQFHNFLLLPKSKLFIWNKKIFFQSTYYHPATYKWTKKSCSKKSWKCKGFFSFHGCDFKSTLPICPVSTYKRTNFLIYDQPLKLVKSSWICRGMFLLLSIFLAGRWFFERILSSHSAITKHILLNITTWTFLWKNKSRSKNDRDIVADDFLNFSPFFSGLWF